MKNRTYNKKKILVVFGCAFAILFGLIGRLVYLMVFDAEYYQEKAEALHAVSYTHLDVYKRQEQKKWRRCF